jgi:hypothetical protein
MSTPIRAFAVTVALLAAVAAGAILTGVGGTGPSLSPSLSPSPSPASPSTGSTPTASDAADASPPAITCENDLPGCAGLLEAGAHGSKHFAPRLIHFETPAGWINTIDTPTIYKLDAPGAAASILLWTDVSIEDQTATSCEPVARAGGVTAKADEWVAYLAAHRGLVTTTPAPFDFAGNQDKRTQVMDIRMAPTWTATCPGRADPEVLFVAHPSAPAAVYGVGPADRVRLIVLDTETYGSHTVLIEVYGPLDDAGFDATMRITDPVLRTFVFGCGPGAGYGPCGGYASAAP